MGRQQRRRGRPEEVKRLKAERNCRGRGTEINMAAGSFRVNMEGGKADEGQGDEPDVPDGPGGVPGTTAGGK